MQGGGVSQANQNAALLGSLGGGLSGIGGAAGGLLGGPLGAVAGEKIGEVASAVASFGLESFKANANFEALKASVETFAGAEAPSLIKEIEDFAIANPVANLEASVKSLSGLLAQGLSGQESIAVIKGLTEVTGGNVEQFERLAYQIAQIRTRGKLTGDNLKDLAQSGFAPLEFIAQRTGESLAQVQDRMSKGKVTYQEVLQALNDATTGLGRFAGRSAAIAKTSAGAIANLEDSITTFKIAFGELLSNSGLTNFVRDISEVTRALTSMIKSFNGAKESTDGFSRGLNEFAKYSMPVFGQVALAWDLMTAGAKEYNNAQNAAKEAAKGLDITKISPFIKDRTPLVFPIEDALTASKKKQEQIVQETNLRIKDLLEKQGEEELSIAESSELQRLLQERKKYGVLSKEEDKWLKSTLKAQQKANEDRLKEEKATTEKLKAALLDRNEQLASLQDKIALENLGETESDISRRYKIELDAELRQIEANKQRVKSEIVATTQAQQSAKATLLATYDKEAELVRELSAKKESTDVKKYNEERVKELESFNNQILDLRKQNQQELYSILKETQANEILIINDRKRFKDAEIQADFERLKRY